jgi:hypothetical protein
LIAEQFEGGFIKNCLEYDIYQTTVYEAADEFGDKLEDTDIRDLIILYSMNNSFTGQTVFDLYGYYRTNLRGRPVDMLLTPIPKPNSVETKPVAPSKIIIKMPEQPKIVMPQSKNKSFVLFPKSGSMPKLLGQDEIFRPFVMK